MKEYEILNVPNSLIEFTRNEYEGFIKVFDEKVEDVFLIE